MSPTFVYFKLVSRQQTSQISQIITNIQICSSFHGSPGPSKHSTKLFHMLLSRFPLCPSLPRSRCGHPPGPCCCCHSHPTTFHCTSSRPPTKTALLAGAAAHHMYQLPSNNIQPTYSSPDPPRPTKHPAYSIISIITIVFISRAIQ